MVRLWADFGGTFWVTKTQNFSGYENLKKSLGRKRIHLGPHFFRIFQFTKIWAFFFRHFLSYFLRSFSGHFGCHFGGPFKGCFWEVILGLWDGAGVVSVGDGGVWCRWEREREDVVGDSERGWV